MIKRALIQQSEIINRRYEANYMPRIQRALHGYVKEVISRLQSQGVGAAQSWVRSNLINARLTPVLLDLYEKVGRRNAQLDYSRLLHERQQKNFGFNYQWTQIILDFLGRDNLSKVVLEISRTTRLGLLRALSAGIAAGWSNEQIVARLEDWQFERFQAARIVRTEVNKAANVGHMAQAETDEYLQTKEWVSAQDHRVRGTRPEDHASHVGLNGTRLDNEDIFVDPRNGDHLRFPGDPKASAASVINCRCRVVHQYKRDAQGNLIPKRRSTTVIYPAQIRRPQMVTI